MLNKNMAQPDEVFEESAAVYDLIYADKDSRSEVEWLIATLRRGGLEQGSKILEIGVGTGRHARHLADLGFSVTGVDLSGEMLSRVVPHPNLKLHQGDGRSIRLEIEFDTVLALFHVVSYQSDIADVRDFFETAARHVRRGGLFGFDVWYSPAVNHQTPTPRVITRSNDSLRVTRTATSEENTRDSLVDVKYTYEVLNLESGGKSVFEELHRMRHFSYTEILLLASDFGFEVVAEEEFMTGQAPSRETWGVWFLLRKR